MPGSRWTLTRGMPSLAGSQAMLCWYERTLRLVPTTRWERNVFWCDGFEAIDSMLGGTSGKFPLFNRGSPACTKSFMKMSPEECSPIHFPESTINSLVLVWMLLGDFVRISPCLCSTQAVRLHRAQWPGYSKKCEVTCSLLVSQVHFPSFFMATCLIFPMVTAI